jgi:hypothetical protein
MPKTNANQDHYKVSGRDEKGRLPSDPDVTPEELPRSRARIARGEDAPPHPNPTNEVDLEKLNQRLNESLEQDDEPRKNA